jgi:hypothetical protein
VGFAGNQRTLFKYLDADGGGTLTFDELDARVLEALHWQERPSATLGCPVYLYQCANKHALKPSTPLAQYLSRGFQDNSTAVAKIRVAGHDKHFMQVALSEGTHFGILGDAKAMQQLALELCEMYFTVRRRINIILGDVETMRRQAKAAFEKTQTRIKERADKNEAQGLRPANDTGRGREQRLKQASSSWTSYERRFRYKSMWEDLYDIHHKSKRKQHDSNEGRPHTALAEVKTVTAAEEELRPATAASAPM